MPTFDHLRWHLALALGGALVIERLHGPFATGLLALIVVDRVATAAIPYLRRQRGAEHAPAVTMTDRRLVATTGRAMRPRSIALARALDADCASCRGFGCRTCAYTGLG